MASEVDWTSVSGSNGSKSSGNREQIKYVKFEAGSDKTLRPIGKAVMFYKFFVRGPNGARSVVVDPEYKNEASAKLSAHSGQEIKPSLRYAINVIDRADQQVKILEGGQSIFEHFASWSAGNGGAAPGGESGWDWRITARGDGLNRKYTCTPIKVAVLTTDEITRIKDKKEYYTLNEIYKGTPLDEVIEKAFGDRSNSGPEPVAPQTVGSIIDSDNPANW